MTVKKLAVFADGSLQEFEFSLSGTQSPHMDAQASAPSNCIAIASSVEAAQQMYEDYMNPLVDDNDGSPTQIWIEEETGTLCWGSGTYQADRLATREEYESADRCVGSVFEALEPGENIQLADGYYVLDNDLDLVQDWQIV